MAEIKDALELDSKLPKEAPAKQKTSPEVAKANSSELAENNSGRQAKVNEDGNQGNQETDNLNKKTEQPETDDNKTEQPVTEDNKLGETETSGDGLKKPEDEPLTANENTEDGTGKPKKSVENQPISARRDAPLENDEVGDLSKKEKNNANEGKVVTDEKKTPRESAKTVEEGKKVPENNGKTVEEGKKDTKENEKAAVGDEKTPNEEVNDSTEKENVSDEDVGAKENEKKTPQSRETDDSAVDGKVRKNEEDTEDRPKEAGDKKTEEEVPLQYGNEKAPEYSPQKTDLQNAQDDLDFAKEQKKAYMSAVKAGEIPQDKAVKDQLNESIRNAKENLAKVKNGQPYSYENYMDYWTSPEGIKKSGNIFAAGTDFLVKQIGKAHGLNGGTDVSNAAKNFGRYYGENFGNKQIGKVADGTSSLMKNVYDANATPHDRYMQSHFLRDANGKPITAAEGRDAAFKNIIPEGLQEQINKPDKQGEDVKNLKKNEDKDVKATPHDVSNMKTKENDDIRNSPLGANDKMKSPEKNEPLDIEKIKSISDEKKDVKLPDDIAKTFKDGKYDTLVLKEPISAYRYFGSYSPEEMAKAKEKEAAYNEKNPDKIDPKDRNKDEKIDYQRNPLYGDAVNDLRNDLSKHKEITPEQFNNYMEKLSNDDGGLLRNMLNKEHGASPDFIQDNAKMMSDMMRVDDGWGSDAFGSFMTLNPNISPEEAKNLYAIKDTWGNPMLYRSKIEIPAGTEIHIGKVGEQNNAGEILPGGETQIYLGNWTPEQANGWIKECGRVGEIPQKEEIGADNQIDRPLGDTVKNDTPLDAPSQNDKAFNIPSNSNSSIENATDDVNKN